MSKKPGIKPRLEIINKKLAGLMDVVPSVITFGEVREQMAQDLYKTLTGIVLSRRDLKKYYILVHVNVDFRSPDGNLLKEKIILMKQRPPKMLGSICFFINNKTGDAERLWVLPMDLPQSDGILKNSTHVPELVMAR